MRNATNFGWYIKHSTQVTLRSNWQRTNLHTALLCQAGEASESQLTPYVRHEKFWFEVFRCESDATFLRSWFGWKSNKIVHISRPESFFAFICMFRRYLNCHLLPDFRCPIQKSSRLSETLLFMPGSSSWLLIARLRWRENTLGMVKEPENQGNHVVRGPITVLPIYGSDQRELNVEIVTKW